MIVRALAAPLVAAALALSGCTAMAPVNPSIARVDPDAGYQAFDVAPEHCLSWPRCSAPIDRGPA